MKRKKIVISKTPHRIGLIGGGTDIPSYFKKNNGAVINFAIDKYIYVTVKSHSQFYDEKYRINYSKTEFCNNVDEIKNNIIRETLKYFNIDFPLYIETNSDVPSSSGLGSSSAFTVGLVSGIAEYIGLNLSKMQIAEIACDIEINRVGSPIGKQDQYAATFGGINHFLFKKNNTVNVTPIKFTKLFKEAFIDNSYILWSGVQRSANEILSCQIDEMHSLDKYYSELNKLTAEFYSLLSMDESEVKKYDLYNILNMAWVTKQKFNNKINTSFVSNIINSVKKYANHLKICGAGGGGFLYINLNIDKYDFNMKTTCNFEFENINICNCGTEIIYMR